MKISGHIAVTAAGVVLASAGVLMPLGSSISEASESIDQLRQTIGPEIHVQVEIQSLLGRIDECEDQISNSDVQLCPDTPSATNDFESALADAVAETGLRRVSMDSAPGQPLGGMNSFVIDLGVEGSATQLHELLAAVEQMAWVTRVLKLELMKGEAVRTLQLRLAVLLETD
jgi:hypothetical protein